MLLKITNICSVRTRSTTSSVKHDSEINIITNTKMKQSKYHNDDLKLKHKETTSTKLHSAILDFLFLCCFSVVCFIFVCLFLLLLLLFFVVVVVVLLLLLFYIWWGGGGGWWGLNFWFRCFCSEFSVLSFCDVSLLS